MENTRAVLGALFFIALVLGANFIMYGISRSIVNSKRGNFLEMLSKSISGPVKKKDPMEELHRQIQELERGKKDDSADSK